MIRERRRNLAFDVIDRECSCTVWPTDLLLLTVVWKDVNRLSACCFYWRKLGTGLDWQHAAAVTGSNFYGPKQIEMTALNCVTSCYSPSQIYVLCLDIRQRKFSFEAGGGKWQAANDLKTYLITGSQTNVTDTEKWDHNANIKVYSRADNLDVWKSREVFPSHSQSVSSFHSSNWIWYVETIFPWVSLGVGAPAHSW
jgi:hypothetical protein